MPDKPFHNRPPSQRGENFPPPNLDYGVLSVHPRQMPLFKEELPSRDCFISGDERHPDEGRIYIPWDNIAAKVTRQQVEFLQGE